MANATDAVPNPRRRASTQPNHRPTARLSQPRPLKYFGSEFVASYWSLTISTSAGQVPAAWLSCLHHWAERHTLQAIFSVEVGLKNQQPHIQGAFVGHWATHDAGKTELSAALRAACSMVPQDKAKTLIKPLQGQQRWPEMIGYCLKDWGKPHFALVVKDLTEAELDAARQAYGYVSNTMDNRTEISKANLFKLATNFYRLNLSPIPPAVMTLPCVLRFMLLDRKFYPHANWILSATGHRLDYDRASQMWQFCADPDGPVPISHVNDIFFKHKAHDPMRPDDAAGPYGFEEMALQDVRTQALELRQSAFSLQDYLSNRRSANHVPVPSELQADFLDLPGSARLSREYDQPEVILTLMFPCFPLLCLHAGCTQQHPTACQATAVVLHIVCSAPSCQSLCTVPCSFHTTHTLSPPVSSMFP